MAKVDVDDLPARPPKKRRALAQVPDVWLARWSAGEGDLTPADKRMVEEEREYRKRIAKTKDFKVGIIVSPYGMPPVQFEAVQKAALAAGASEFHYFQLPSNLHNALRENTKVVRHTDPAWKESEERDKEIVRSSDLVIAAPKETTVQPYSSGGVWSIIGYAKNRGVAVKTILRNGQEQAT